ncbi:unnamed protein product [Brachionus calyciflorus]|uniref:Actin-related protein 2/3 complex subunit 3 n=1 Tax=Brachionus calyciflorus TaxID=104777 RepID=A0A813M4T8_9BILA|nr:unnamed protein product [Brachionus calyciflorus]
MPAYHSRFADCNLKIANMSLLPLRTQSRGPAPKETNPEAIDIIDEAITYFKANIFFKSFDIRSNADRVLIYITLYISECLRVLLKNQGKIQAIKDLDTLANSKFDIPGEAGFPLNAVYAKPSSPKEGEDLRAYIKQIRIETGLRICNKVYEEHGDKPSKWWLCFAKKRFMDKTLTSLGQMI